MVIVGALPSDVMVMRSEDVLRRVARGHRDDIGARLRASLAPTTTSCRGDAAAAAIVRPPPSVTPKKSDAAADRQRRAVVVSVSRRRRRGRIDGATTSVRVMVGRLWPRCQRRPWRSPSMTLAPAARRRSRSTTQSFQWRRRCPLAIRPVHLRHADVVRRRAAQRDRRRRGRERSARGWRRDVHRWRHHRCASPSGRRFR